MSILPYLLQELSQPTVYDQHFGLGLWDDDLFLRPQHLGFNYHPFSLRSYNRPYRLISASRSGLSNVQNDKNNFKVNLDVQQFKPNEVSVKVENGYIVVDGKHEERSDEHGYISRQFTRRYKVPDNVDAAAITSTLSSDGVLSVGAPKKKIEDSNNTIPIQIVQTNEPSIKGPQKEKENGNIVENKQ